MNNNHQFLRELGALSAKYKVKIHGCGCCGSPTLVDLAPDEISDESGYAAPGGDYLTWVSPTDKYSWAELSNEVVPHNPQPAKAL